MELRNAALGDVPMLVATGDIDHSTCGVLREALDKWLQSGFHIVFLDLSEVVHMDSGGISVLVAAAQALRRGGWVGVVGPNADIRGLLESAGLLVDPNFRVFDTRQAARVVTGDRAST